MALGDGVSALASLGVTFGGFSPTVIDGVAASKEYVEQLEKAEAERKEAARRKRELEMARTSKPRLFTGEDGATWTYVVIDETIVRLLTCDFHGTRLEIPAEVEGMPVVALGPDACSRSEEIEEVVVPNSIETIGSCAFRYCPKLKRITLPEKVAEYSASWVSHCPNLEEMVLPGGLGKLDLDVFDNSGLKRLVIGPNVHEIVPGAFQKTQLENLIVHEDNPFIITDGTAIYSIDGRVMLALARPVSHYDIRTGCTALAKKAMYGVEALKSVSIPEGVVALGDFAFSHSGLRRVTMPSTMTSIGEKAFFYCKDFREIELNEGLLAIGDSAFEQSSLEALYIPASIEAIGSSITAATNVVHTGPACTLKIDNASPALFIDGAGGLYRREDDGVHMIQLIHREAESYSAWSGVSVIDPYAFAFHPNIQEVTLPEGLCSIGASAFRCCGKLRSIELPDSVETIGDDAFLDTVIEEFRVPASLDHLGHNALVTHAAHHGDKQPSLRAIEVSEGNGKFYMKSGILCMRKQDAASALLFTSSESRVVIPPEVDRIEDYAFNNARGIEYLEIGPGLKTIGTCGLMVWCWIEHIHVETAKELEGRTQFDFYFPDTSKSIHGISMGVGGASWVNVPLIMAQYDNCIASAHDYNSPRNPDSISVYEQTRLMIERLDDPILLTPVNRNLFDRVMRWHIVEICVDVARNDDRRIVDRLLDFGYINEDNLEEIIEAVNKLQDAAMTGYLLELKRRRFNRSAFDFDL